MDDALGLRGLAVVLPRNNQIPLLYRAAQDARAQKAADIKRIDDEFAHIKLGLPTVRTELQGGLAQMFKDTYSGLSEIQRDAYQKGNLTSEHRTAKNNLMSNFDMQSAMVQSYNEDLKTLSGAINAKPEMFNKAMVVQKTDDILRGAFIKDDKGNVVGFNTTMPSPSEILKDPDIYDDRTLVENYVKGLATVTTANLSDSGDFTDTRSEEFKAALFQTDANGKVILDPNSGLPVPKASPEAIYQWDSDPINKLKLDKWAQQITPEGEDWRKFRAQAFNERVVSNYAPYKETVKRQNKPESSTGKAQKEQDASNRYATIRKIIDNFDESALAQTYSMNDRVKVEFSGNKYKPGESIPDKIMVYKREQLPVDPMDPFAVKFSDWKLADQISIRDDKDKESAIFKINSLLDDAGDKSTLKIGNDAIREVHNKSKKKYSGKSEADEFGIN